MIQSIIAAYRHWMESFDRAMFTLGYMLTALAYGSYQHCKGISIVLVKRLKGDHSDSEYADSLFERGDESFDRFLNLVRTIIPDKWRKMISYEAGFW